MKYLIGVGVLMALALVVRFTFQRFGVAIHVHDTYWVIPIRKIVFWILIAMAAVPLVIVVWKLVRHNS